MTHGELEARILDVDRAQASAPLDVSRELRLTAQAEADAWHQSADAEIRHDPAASASATALARHMAAQREQLEAANERYDKWAADTSSRREAAGKARAELQRRELAQQTAGQRQPEPEDQPQTVVEWWRQLDTDLAAVDRAIEREHQAAIAAGQPWPPQRTAPAETTHAEAAAVIARLRRDRYLPEPNPDPEAPTSEPGAANTAALAPQHEPGHRPARLDALQARADEARTASPPPTLRGKPARNTRPALNAKLTPKPNQRPNARPKPRTGSRSSYRSGLHRRDPVRGAQHARGFDRGDGRIEVRHDFGPDFARASARTCSISTVDPLTLVNLTREVRLPGVRGPWFAPR
jgi:hypothetical protein